MRTAIFSLVALPLLGAAWLGSRLGLSVDPRGGFPVALAALAVAAGLLAALALPLAAPRLPARRMSRSRLGGELGTVLLCLAGPPLLGQWEIPLAFVLFAVLGLRLLRCAQVERHAAALAVGLDFGLEVVFVHAGAYAYAWSTVAPLPLWLPAVWANLGIAALRLHAHLSGLPQGSPVPSPRP